MSLNGGAQRNQAVDVLRGIAMLFVVLGHTMTGVTAGAENSLLFNALWTLQMPLFFMISGYVTKYGRAPVGCCRLLSRLGKKTLVYLLPYAVWTVGVRGLILQKSEYLDLKFLVYNMDSGYWFLFSIWMIAVFYELSRYLSAKLCKNKSKWINIAVLTGFYFLFAVPLVLVGVKMGLSFLCIKLTLYYMPFFCLGFLYGWFKDNASLPFAATKAADVISVFCLVIWITLILRFNFYSIEEGIWGIALRAVASLAGCVALCSAVSHLVNSSSSAVQSRSGECGGGLARGVISFFSSIGTVTLEIYLIHSLFLSMVRFDTLPEFSSPKGVGATAVNFVLTLTVTFVVAKLLGGHPILRGVCFGRFKSSSKKAAETKA